MPEFMLLLRGQGEWDTMSPAQLQEAMQQYLSWSRELREAGRNGGGDELGPERRVIGPKPDHVVTEGPFVETREVVGGYFIVKAASMDEAVEVSMGCPHLRFGGSIEVRPIVQDPGS
jgi:hypothetical protein